MGTKINLISLDRQLVEVDIKAHFEQIGPVKSVKLMREGGRSMGIAVVEMGSAEDAKVAVQKLNQSELGSKTFVATLIKDPTPKYVPPKPMPMTEGLQKDLFTFSESWEIKPGLGVGPLKLGMTANEIGLLLERKPQFLKDHKAIYFPSDTSKQRMSILRKIGKRADYRGFHSEDRLGLMVFLDETGGASRFDFTFPDVQLSFAGVPLLGRRGIEVTPLVNAIEPFALLFGPDYIVCPKLGFQVLAFQADDIGSDVNHYLNFPSVFSADYYAKHMRPNLEREPVPELRFTREKFLDLLRKSPIWKDRNEDVIQLEFSDKTTEGNDEKSKIGGHPILNPDEKAAKCPECKREMSLLIQLETGKFLASFVPGTTKGLLQIFFCFNEDCESQGEMGIPLDDSKTRILQVVKGSRITPLKHALPEHRLAGAKKSVDFADPSVAPKYKTWLKTLDEDPKSQLQYHLHNFFPIAGEKLGGFPCWIQEPAIPCCDLCLKQKKVSEMKFVLEIGSHSDWDIMFGDVGEAYVFQCEEHPEQFKLLWQCG